MGENNAGKSTVFQAVVYAINQPPQLPESYFYNTEHPVVFSCTFSGIEAADLDRLSAEHRPKIEPLVYDGTFNLLVRYNPCEKVDVKVLKKVPAESRFQSRAK
ncbi:MAG: hypothetical protein IPG64_10785 [Haliea sp.]|nr:hypothetical protein [Haliea sp.]